MSTRPRSYGALPVAVDPRTPGSVIVPLGDDDALWLGLRAVDETRPVAVRIAALTPGRVDAISGGLWKETLEREIQNYLVCPPQRSLDGIQYGKTWARQFARTARSSGAVSCERLEVLVYPPERTLPALAPASVESDEAPAPGTTPFATSRDEEAEQGQPDAAVSQIITADPFGPDIWSGPACIVSLVLVTPEMFTELTGAPLLPPLDDADMYGGWRLP